MNNELQKLPPFAEEVMSKLRRFDECANDFEADGVDIGRDWLDTLTHLGVLERVQRSPAMWQTTPEGDALLEAYGPPAAMDESNFAPGGWKIEKTPDGGFCLSHPTHGRGFFSDRGHKPAVVVSRFLDALLTYGPTGERLQAEIAALQQRLNIADQRVDDLQKDKERLDALEANYWDVRHHSSALADTGDYTSSVEIVGHWMDKPNERVIGENYNENLRAAIDQAMTADAYPPARPEYPELDEAMSEQEGS